MLSLNVKEYFIEHNPGLRRIVQDQHSCRVIGLDSDIGVFVHGWMGVRGKKTTK